MNSQLIRFFFFMLLCASSTHKLNAQGALLQQRIYLECENCSPSDAIIAIHNSTGINFTYSGNFFDGCPTVTIKAVDQPLEQVLQQITKGCKPVVIKEERNQIRITLDDPKITITGTVRDKETNEKLIGAAVYLWQNGKSARSITDEHGRYTHQSRIGKCTLAVISYLGYDSTFFVINPNKDVFMDLKVAPSTSELKQVVVTAQKFRNNWSSIDELGARVPPKPASKDIMTLVGHYDVFRAASLLPGIQTGVDGLSGFHVRGGNADQNLVLLDDVPVYVPTHAVGLLSVFNSDLVKHTQVWKGDFPARYGGRIASVVDVRTREGNSKVFQGGATVNPIMASGYVEGPLRRDKGSFIASFRHSLFGPWIQYARNSPNLLNVSFAPNTDYRVKDVNLKLNYEWARFGELSFSYYYGNDNLNAPFSKSTLSEGLGSLEEYYRLGSKWGNHIAALHWNKNWGGKVFSNTTLSRSKFKYDSELSLNSEFVDLADRRSPVSNYSQLFLTDINDLSLRTDYNWQVKPEWSLKWGGSATHHQFKPGTASVNLSLPGQTQILIDSLKRDYANSKPLEAQEYESYGEFVWKKPGKWIISTGLHASAFHIDSKYFYALLPRLRIVHGKQDYGFKQWANYHQTAQYLHQVGGFNVGLPFELWVPSTRKVQPDRAWQASVGMGCDNKDWGITVEAYYKKLNSTVILQSVNGALLTAGAQDASGWEERVTAGQGLAKGIEVIGERKTGTHRGFVSYTLSRSTRQFDALNGGRVFPYQFDRTHDFKVNYSYYLNKYINCSASWVWMTGSPITLAVVKYKFQTTNSSLGIKEVLYYPELNGFRLPPNHRLDLVANLYFNQKVYSRTVKHHLQIGVYNLYNRANPFYMVIERSNGVKDRAIFYTLFPVLPMFRYDISI